MRLDILNPTTLFTSALVVLASCGGGGSTGDAPTPEAKNGFVDLTVEVASDAPEMVLTAELANSGPVEFRSTMSYSFEVPAGRQTLTISGLHEHCSIEGGTSRLIDVVADKRTALRLEIQYEVPAPKIGDLLVTTSTDGDALASTVTLRVDDGEAISLTLADSRKFTDLEAGEHTVALSGLEQGYFVTDGSSRTVTIEDGKTAQIDFVITKEPFGRSFTHITRPNTVTGNVSKIDDVELNGDSTMMIQATNNLTPGGIEGEASNHNLGVWYWGSAEQWTVFNQDKQEMSAFTSFNIFVPAPEMTSFTHVVDASKNAPYGGSLIDHPSLNANFGAKVFVTPNWNTGVYVDWAFGVYYDDLADKWAITNNGPHNPAPEGANFNVLVVGGEKSNAFTHTASHDNAGPNGETILDHPRLNGNPNAKLIVTENWSVGAGSPGNLRPIGVAYRDGRWTIQNNGGTAIEINSHYNVLIDEGLATAQ